MTLGAPAGFAAVAIGQTSTPNATASSSPRTPVPLVRRLCASPNRRDDAVESGGWSYGCGPPRIGDLSGPHKSAGSTSTTSHTRLECAEAIGQPNGSRGAGVAVVDESKLAEELQHFEVVLAKTEVNGLAFGFGNVPEALPDGRTALCVTQISPDGLCAQWNTRYPDRRLEVGDRIMAVNGVGDDFLRMRQLLCGPFVRLLVRRCSLVGLRSLEASPACTPHTPSGDEPREAKIHGDASGSQLISNHAGNGSLSGPRRSAAHDGFSKADYCNADSLAVRGKTMRDSPVFIRGLSGRALVETQLVGSVDEVGRQAQLSNDLAERELRIQELERQLRIWRDSEPTSSTRVASAQCRTTRIGIRCNGANTEHADKSVVDGITTLRSPHEVSIPRPSATVLVDQGIINTFNVGDRADASIGMPFSRETGFLEHDASCLRTSFPNCDMEMKTFPVLSKNLATSGHRNDHAMSPKQRCSNVQVHQAKVDAVLDHNVIVLRQVVDARKEVCELEAQMEVMRRSFHNECSELFARSAEDRAEMLATQRDAESAKQRLAECEIAKQLVLERHSLELEQYMALTNAEVAYRQRERGQREEVERVQALCLATRSEFNLQRQELDKSCVELARFENLLGAMTSELDNQRCELRESRLQLLRCTSENHEAAVAVANLEAKTGIECDELKAQLAAEREQANRSLIALEEHLRILEKVEASTSAEALRQVAQIEARSADRLCRFEKHERSVSTEVEARVAEAEIQHAVEKEIGVKEMAQVKAVAEDAMARLRAAEASEQEHIDLRLAQLHEFKRRWIGERSRWQERESELRRTIQREAIAAASEVAKLSATLEVAKCERLLEESSAEERLRFEESALRAASDQLQRMEQKASAWREEAQQHENDADRLRNQHTMLAHSRESGLQDVSNQLRKAEQTATAWHMQADQFERAEHKLQGELLDFMHRARGELQASQKQLERVEETVVERHKSVLDLTIVEQKLRSELFMCRAELQECPNQYRPQTSKALPASRGAAACRLHLPLFDHDEDDSTREPEECEYDEDEDEAGEKDEAALQRIAQRLSEKERCLAARLLQRDEEIEQLQCRMRMAALRAQESTVEELQKAQASFWYEQQVSQKAVSEVQEALDNNARERLEHRRIQRRLADMLGQEELEVQIVHEELRSRAADAEFLRQRIVDLESELCSRQRSDGARASRLDPWVASSQTLDELKPLRLPFTEQHHSQEAHTTNSPCEPDFPVLDDKSTRETPRSKQLEHPVGSGTRGNTFFQRFPDLVCSDAQTENPSQEKAFVFHIPGDAVVDSPIRAAPAPATPPITPHTMASRGGGESDTTGLMSPELQGKSGMHWMASPPTADLLQMDTILEGDYTQEFDDELDHALEREIVALGHGCLRGCKLQRDTKAKPRAGMIKYTLDGRSFMMRFNSDEGVLVRSGPSWKPFHEWLKSVQDDDSVDAETAALLANRRAL